MTLTLTWLAVAGAAIVLGYRWRRRVALLCLLVVATAAALGLTTMATGDIAPDLFAQAAAIVVATVVLAVLTVLLVTRGLGPLVSRHDRTSAAMVCGALAAMYAAVALFLAVAATETMEVERLPVLRDRDAFVAWRDSPQASGAVLLAGTVNARTPAPGPQQDVVASHSCLALGSQHLPLPGHRLPDHYLVDFPGGPPIVVDGIGSGTQAWRWPGPDAGECVLRRGDRVVVWGRLQGGMGGGTTSHTGLADVRIVAAGDPATFLAGYAPAARHTGRAVLALAALNGALAALTAVVGFRTYRRLARTGTDAPARITWRSGPR